MRYSILFISIPVTPLTALESPCWGFNWAGVPGQQLYEPVREALLAKCFYEIRGPDFNFDDTRNSETNVGVSQKSCTDCHQAYVIRDVP